jgi:hypothetical protein
MSIIFYFRLKFHRKDGEKVPGGKILTGLEKVAVWFLGKKEYPFVGWILDKDLPSQERPEGAGSSRSLKFSPLGFGEALRSFRIHSSRWDNGVRGLVCFRPIYRL